MSTQHNVTVAGDNASALVFDPPLCNGAGWNTTTHASGVSKSCTIDDKSVTPSANLTFTGVDVFYTSYLLSPGSIAFTLDGKAAGNITVTVGKNATATEGAQVMWNATGLENKEHVLQLRPANASSRALNVDGFIITQVDTNSTTTVAPQPTAGAGSAIVGGLQAQSPQTTRITIGLGVTFGALSFFVFLGIAIFLHRRTRVMSKRYSWNKSIPPIRTQDADGGTRAYTPDSEFQSPVTEPGMSGMGGTALPMRHLPSGASMHEFDGEELKSETTTKGWGSPAPSHAHLLPEQSSPTSQGHDDGRAAKPVRAPTLSGPRARADFTHGATAFVPRTNTTVATRLEPVRAASASPVESSVSRSTTTRLEPVRRGTVPRNS